MAELEAEIATTGSQLEELQNDAGDAGDDLEDTGDAAENSGEAVEAFGEAAEVAGEVAVAAFEAVVAAAAAVGTAVIAAGTAVGSAMVDSTMQTSQLADELLTLSSTTGLTTDTLQELNYASELLDVDTQTVTGSMTKLLKTMSSADPPPGCSPPYDGLPQSAGPHPSGSGHSCAAWGCGLPAGRPCPRRSSGYTGRGRRC